MEALVVGGVSLVINLLSGGVMWFMKQTIKELRETDKDLRDKIDHVKEHYYRKEDFKEFKEELWGRLDKMEGSIHELRKQ